MVTWMFFVSIFFFDAYISLCKILERKIGVFPTTEAHCGLSSGSVVKNPPAVQKLQEIWVPPLC